MKFFEQCRSHTCSYHTCHMVSMLSKQRKKVNINSVLPKKKKKTPNLAGRITYLSYYLSIVKSPHATFTLYWISERYSDKSMVHTCFILMNVSTVCIRTYFLALSDGLFLNHHVKSLFCLYRHILRGSLQFAHVDQALETISHGTPLPARFSPFIEMCIVQYALCMPSGKCIKMSPPLKWIRKSMMLNIHLNVKCTLNFMGVILSPLMQVEVNDILTSVEWSPDHFEEDNLKRGKDNREGALKVHIAMTTTCTRAPPSSKSAHGICSSKSRDPK